MFPALGAVLGYAQQSAIEQAQNQALILNNDKATGPNLIDYLMPQNWNQQSNEMSHNNS
jgi:hypothetical protein